MNVEKNELKSLLILYSYHHMNTEKIAKVFAKVLNCEIKTPDEVEIENLKNYDLIGFGSGIYSAKHHESILELADNLPEMNGEKVFLFSTAGITGENKALKDHSKLKEKLESKGYLVIDDFQCKGFNTNSFLKLFGGMNKSKPDAQDLKNAEEFALNLKQKL
ncbi:flavodoxin family protein [Methanobacterium alcaliphilum]|uniref:flavodoxin family protein n=1 Tax=Methanobacterium alcaliphilum TaxID=392018 RepID=UPI002009EA5B|nr:flavodoxin family protein [Methanobacterium alcaliphilum]MCK9151370.1 flavodoxin family protein [Methanobacterium alcaliphilum]